ncbi:hypothetical protein [Catellatospora sp. NPDC049609]|uniref:hypothetical protein n=1 Tax=Catellatospora sp. NPDC049609 TaxID=3155505 RepID=UPI003434DD5C
MTARFEFYERASAGVTWRLLSSNNRDLGRSDNGFPDVEACLRAVDEVRAAVAEVEPMIHRVSRLAWAWRLEAAPGSVAVASRAYQRRVQAQTACDLFLRLAAAAPVNPEVRQTRT